MNTQHEVPKTRAALITKVNTSIVIADLKREALFSRHQRRTTDDSTIDVSNQDPTFNRLHV